MFLGRRQRSGEESPEWICESRCLQVSVRLHVFAGFFLPLNLSTTTQFMLGLHFTPVCILLSVCSLHFTLSLHFSPGPQSAVCSPQSAFYTLTVKKLRNEGTSFVLQTARPSRGSDDHVKWRSRLH